MHDGSKPFFLCILQWSVISCERLLIDQPIILSSDFFQELLEHLQYLKHESLSREATVRLHRLSKPHMLLPCELS